MRYLITGGAGFVGSNLCRSIVESDSGAEVVALDNLRRRGSEMNLPTLKKLGVTFAHGDIRNAGDLDELSGAFDVFIEASAEPSVHAGTDGSPRYVLDTNLNGTLNCLEFARSRCGGMIFLSTSRVCAIPALCALRLEEGETRLEPAAEQDVPGFADSSVNEDFPVCGAGFRSFYGSTKLASELFVEEYAANLDFPAVINRCGAIAGAGQFGRTDQGVFTLWVARHAFGGALKYTGFGGKGKQVRDILHPHDLHDLLRRQVEALSGLRGEIFCVGGGLAGSVSLLEYTALCQEVTGESIEIGSQPETAAVDVPYYVTDHRKVTQRFGWSPKIAPRKIVKDIYAWLTSDAERLRTLFAPATVDAAKGS